MYPVLEASALAELCERPEFITKVTMDYFVTTPDKEGLWYAIMAHTLLLKGGYPHDPHQEHWDRDPLYLAEDTCPLIWEKAEYLRNSPRTRPAVPDGSLVVFCADNHAEPVMNFGFILQSFAGHIPYKTEMTYRCHAMPSRLWALCKYPYEPVDHTPIPDIYDKRRIEEDCLENLGVLPQTRAC